MREINILYIHGMGGGGDSRIPSILKEHFDGLCPACGIAFEARSAVVEGGFEDSDGSAGLESGLECGGRSTGRAVEDGRPDNGYKVNVVVRTYDFNPDIARGQINAWVRELRPALVIGESLGAVQALQVRGMPHIFVSPSLNAPIYLTMFAPLALIPGVTALLDWVYRPKPGDRQPLHFTFKTLRHYYAHRREALASLPDTYFAFFGRHDHYRRSGVVSVRTWRRHFGSGTWALYDGTHFMEEEFIHSLLIPKILKTLNLHTSGVSQP